MHQIEPELSAPPPRNIRLPAHLRRSFFAAAVILGLVSMGAFRALWEAGKLVWLDKAGVTVHARIVDIQTTPGLDPKDPPTQVSVRYEFIPPYPNGVLPRATTVRMPKFDKLSAVNHPVKAHVYKWGDILTFRYARWFGGTLLRPWNRHIGGEILFICLAAGMLLGFCTTVMRRLARSRRRVQDMLRINIATVGTIVNKRATAHQPPRFFVEYRYPAGKVLGEYRREERCTDVQWRQLEVDQRVTVLYDPDDPADAGLYALV